MFTKKDSTFNWLTNEMPGLICYLDKKLNYHFMNMKYKELWKISKTQDITQLTVHDVLGTEYEKVKKYIQKVLNGQEVMYEANFNVAIVQVHYIPDFVNSKDKKSKVKGFYVLGLDVTELRQTQANYQNDLLLEVENKTNHLSDTLENLKKTQNLLIEHEKMASIGNLVAGISHELNTPIGVCLTATTKLASMNHQIQTQYANGSLSQRNLEQFFEDNTKLLTLMESNIQRSAKLVQSFKNVSVSQSNDQIIEIDIVGLLEDTFFSLKPKYKEKNVSFNINIKEPLTIKIYAGLFFQIISNLMNNSFIHGFKEEKKYHIQIDIFKDENRLKIDYYDDGIGLTQEAKNHLFEPLFTTDKKGESSGLGMTIIYNIITQKLLGEIVVSSEEKEGILIKIDLPLGLKGSEKNA